MVPTAAHFFDFLEKANTCDDVHRSLAQYLLELGLLDIRMLKYQPSHVVSAALMLSNELMKQSTVWPVEMVLQSRASADSLRPCADELRQIMESDCARAGGQLQALHKKFSTKERLQTRCDLVPTSYGKSWNLTVPGQAGSYRHYTKSFPQKSVCRLAATLCRRATANHGI